MRWFLWGELLTSICRGCPVAEGRLNHWAKIQSLRNAWGSLWPGSMGLFIHWSSLLYQKLKYGRRITKKKCLTMSLLLQGAWKGFLINFSLLNSVFYGCVWTLSQCLIFFLLVRNPQKHIPWTPSSKYNEKLFKFWHTSKHFFKKFCIVFQKKNINNSHVSSL